MPAPLPLNEPRRLEVLQRYEIVDTEADETYDELTRLAAHICEAPIALISLVTEDRQWFKSRYNCDVAESSREFSFCAHAILAKELCIVPDLTKDERFSDNPFVIGEPHVRFYAGAPLISPEGTTLGTICVLDLVPRFLTEHHQEALRVLSRLVMTKLDLRRKKRETVQAEREQAAVLQALRESEQRALLLSDAFSPIHWSMKEDLTDFQAGERWLEFTGITEEELLRDGWLHTIHPEDREWSSAEIAGARTRREAHGARIRLRHQNGSWRWMLVRVVPLKSEDGTVLRWLGTNVDIHDQYEAETALRLSEQRYRQALDAALLGTWDTSLESGITSWDERGRQQYGISQPSVTTEEAISRVHPEDRERVIATGKMAAQSTDGMYQTEFRVIWPDGSIHWLACNGRVQFSGEGADRKAIRFTGVNRDITERRGAKLALEIKSELLTAVSESLEVFLTHGDWNKALARLLRCALDQTASDYGFIGVVTDDRQEMRVLAYEGMTSEPEMPQAFTEMAQRSFQENGYFIFAEPGNLFGEVITTGKVVIANDLENDSAAQLPPGHPILKTYLGVPIRRGTDIVGMIALANRPQGYTEEERRAMEMLVQQAGVLCDSYRHNEREKSLKSEHEVLELQLRHSQKMEAIGQLAGGVAHDFNNLLTVITGHSELILMQFQTTGPQRDSLLQIARAGERAAQLTRQLLTFSRRQLFQPVPVDLNGVILEIVKMLNRMVGENVSIEPELAAEVPSVLADIGMIEQVLMNLVLNARDALPRGGRIVIKTGSTRIEEADRQQRPGAKVGLNAWLRVLDAGIGIESENLAHIFEPFFTTKEVGAGTGLGLATVYGIVQQHGGWVEVESEAGKGTNFTVYFPTTLASVDETTEEIVPELRGGAETILLVEDEEFVRALAKRVLEDQGYAVLEAASGAEALEMWETHHHDIALLLTDMVMPGKLSGRDVAETLRTTHPTLPVIYSSGYSQELLKSGVELQDGIQYLPKPYRPQQLIETVRDTLDRKN